MIFILDIVHGSFHYLECVIPWLMFYMKQKCIQVFLNGIFYNESYIKLIHSNFQVNYILTCYLPI